MSDAGSTKEEKKDKKDKEPKEKKVGKITPGDYVVHLLIQKGKEFAIPEGETKDLFVQVEICGNKEVSPVKNEVANITVCEFGAHVFVELRK